MDDPLTALGGFLAEVVAQERASLVLFGPPKLLAILIFAMSRVWTTAFHPREILLAVGELKFHLVADGHTESNTPDLFRPPKLSGSGPG